MSFFLSVFILPVAEFYCFDREKVNERASCVGGLMFKFQAFRIYWNFANGLPLEYISKQSGETYRWRESSWKSYYSKLKILKLQNHTE